MHPNPEISTQETKELRGGIQALVEKLNSFQKSRETALAVTKLEEAKMWLGKHLGNIPGNVDLNAERDSKELSS